MKKRIIVILFLVLFFSVSALVYFGQQEEKSEELYYSGTIEAQQANLSFRIAGRVANVYVDEGQHVEKDRTIAELDDSELLLYFEQAKANLELSQKNLQQLELSLRIMKKTLPVEVERAEAGVEALRAGLSELEKGYRVQDIEKSRLALQAARATLEKARKDMERYDRLFDNNIVSEQERDAVQLRYETTLKEYERARESYQQLMEGFRLETIQTARARLEEGKAALKQAKNNLEKIEINRKEMESAKARVRAAEASVKLAETRLGYARLKTPFTGIITTRSIEPGEVVSPGREVFSLSDLSRVDLKIFVGETEIGRVKPGQKVDIKVDTFPDKVFEGKVSFISPEGEFTPKVIQTHKERVKLVYLVEVSIPNPHVELKPGMPADAWLR